MTERGEGPFQDVDLPVAAPSGLHGVQRWLLRQAVKGLLPLRGCWPRYDLDPAPKPGVGGRLSLELVSHCWSYAHLLEGQLGSLIANPPATCDVTMTVYFSREDQDTTRLLEACAEREVPNVTWSFRAAPKQRLFRRSIGRNHAASTTSADWIWFTDCDVLFGPGCLDGLAAALAGRTDPLVFPAVEQLTELLPDDELGAGASQPSGDPDGPAAATPPLLHDPTANHTFVPVPVTKAKGPLQITHGDVARAVGYCRDLAAYQRPEPSFAKCHEDTAFRWLLGTHGVPVDVPAVSRIRHQAKGRYAGSATSGRVRASVRRLQEKLRHPS